MSRQREKRIDRQTNGQTGGQMNIQMNGQTSKWTMRQIYKRTDEQIEMQKNNSWKETNRKTIYFVDMQTLRQVNKKQEGRRTDAQKDKQTGGEIKHEGRPIETY